MWAFFKLANFTNLTDNGLMNKSKFLLLFLPVFVLASCGGNAESSTNSNSSNESNSSESTSNSENTNSSSSSSSSESTSSSTSEEVTYEQVTIKKANDYCDEISVGTNNINTAGDKHISITGRMMFAEGINCTKTGYNSNNLYKLFVFDNTDYIYVGINETMYTNVFSKYEYSDTSYYTFKGVINKYLDQNELIMESYTWLSSYSGPEFGISKIKEFAGSVTSIDDIYSACQSSRMNLKGNVYKNVVSFKGKYIDKVENSLALFANGKKVMRVHGNSKLNNRFSKSSDRTKEAIDSGKTYTIYGVIALYDYVPEIEYLGSEEVTVASEEVTYSLSGVTALTASNVWNIIPDKDSLKDSHYTAYENMAQEIHYFEGYINYSMYSNKMNMLLTDNCATGQYSSALNEANGKALRINNDGETALTSSTDQSYSTFYSQYATSPSQKIGIYFTTKAYNTNHYWQIEVLNRFDISLIA